MTTLPNQRTINAVNDAMAALDALVKDKAQVLTTRKIVEDQTLSVTAGEGYVNGRLYAGDYWEFVGSGRGPGGMPPIDRLQDWINRAGFDLNAWALGKSIAERGTKAWREKKPNTYLSSLEEWQRSPALDNVERAGAADLSDAYVQIIVNELHGKRWQTSRT